LNTGAVHSQLSASQILSLKQVGTDCFQSEHSQNNQIGSVFGGQLMAQALAAGHRTINDAWAPHSLNAYFHRAGTLDQPVEYHIERVRDGRQFAARRIQARQRNSIIFDALCSYQAPEDGPTHQFTELGDLPAAEELTTEREYLAANPHLVPPEIAVLYAQAFPVEIRPIDAQRRFSGKLDHPAMANWMRLESAGGIRSLVHHAMLVAFVSDFRFGPVVSAPHFAPADVGEMFLTTLAHNIVFHAPCRADGWLLHRIESPWAGNGRGLARGQMFSEQGTLVASTCQEVVLRRR
jgi:acyl-CoA thioesterase-2